MTVLGEIRNSCGVAYCNELPAVPESVSWARDRARSLMSSWNLRAEVIETAVLLLSEIMSNAVRHGGSRWPECPAPGEADRVGLVLRCRESELVIEVTDSNQFPPVLVSPARSAVTGRGLFLVAKLSREWGYRNLPHGKKVVYCVVAL